MGSTIINRHSSGLNLYKIESIIPFIPTDFPEPVVPDINKCGIADRSAIIGAPPISFPRLKGISWFDETNFSDSKISLRNTVSLSSFGNSIPIEFFPGTTATRTETALIDRAMSSARSITLLVLIPGAGLSSYNVTIGPGLTFTISPSTAKSLNTVNKSLLFSSIFSSESSVFSVSGNSLRRFNVGNS